MEPAGSLGSPMNTTTTAITTRYLGPTNSRGSRIKVTAGDKSMTVPYDYALDAVPNHEAAACALAKSIHATAAIESSIELSRLHGYTFLFRVPNFR